MQALTTEEMEFVININGTDRHTADVFTDDPVWQDRLKRKGWQPYKIKGVSMWFTIPTRKILSLRTPIDREMSEERKAAARVALESARLRRAATAGA